MINPKNLPKNQANSLKKFEGRLSKLALNKQTVAANENLKIFLENAIQYLNDEKNNKRDPKDAETVAHFLMGKVTFSQLPVPLKEKVQGVNVNLTQEDKNQFYDLLQTHRYNSGIVGFFLGKQEPAEKTIAKLTDVLKKLKQTSPITGSQNLNSQINNNNSINIERNPNLNLSINNNQDKNKEKEIDVNQLKIEEMTNKIAELNKNISSTQENIKKIEESKQPLDNKHNELQTKIKAHEKSKEEISTKLHTLENAIQLRRELEKWRSQQSQKNDSEIKKLPEIINIANDKIQKSETELKKKQSTKIVLESNILLCSKILEQIPDKFIKQVKATNAQTMIPFIQDMNLITSYFVQDHEKLSIKDLTDNLDEKQNVSIELVEQYFAVNSSENKTLRLYEIPESGLEKKQQAAIKDLINQLFGNQIKQQQQEPLSLEYFLNQYLTSKEDNKKLFLKHLITHYCNTSKLNEVNEKNPLSDNIEKLVTSFVRGINTHNEKHKDSWGFKARHDEIIYEVFKIIFDNMRSQISKFKENTENKNNLNDKDIENIKNTIEDFGEGKSILENDYNMYNMQNIYLNNADHYQNNNNLDTEFSEAINETRSNEEEFKDLKLQELREKENLPHLDLSDFSPEKYGNNQKQYKETQNILQMKVAELDQIKGEQATIQEKLILSSNNLVQLQEILAQANEALKKLTQKVEEEIF
jgi:hypothetical protein